MENVVCTSDTTESNSHTIQSTSKAGCIADPTLWKLFFTAIGNTATRCKIWDFHGGEDSSRGLLDCDAEQWCGRIPFFQRTLLPL